MQWKAIAAGALGALMAGSTLAFAQDLGNLPAPFVQDSTVNALFVVGGAAATDDVVGAIDVAMRWGSAPVTSEQISVPGLAAALSVDGEGREVGTRTQPVFLGTNLRKSGLRSTFTDTDMPRLLASDTVFDTDANDEYDYDQFVQFSDDFPLRYSRVSGEEPDPTYKFGEFGTSASPTNFFYRTRIIFTDEVNMTTVVNEDIEILGATYTISPDTSGTCSDTADVVLFGAADTRLLKEGESVTVTVDGVPKTVQLLVVSSADTLAVSVDGQSKSLDKGQSTTLAGISIFVEDIFFSAKEAVASQAEIGIGARELTLNGDSEVEVGIGGDTEFVDGTRVDIVCSGAFLAQVDVFTTSGDSEGDFLAAGGEWVDPVWGSFKVAFPTIVPAADDPSRDTILITPSGDDDVDLTLTTDRGDRATVKWAHASAPTTPTGGLVLTDDNDDAIIVVEGQSMGRDDMFLADAGEFSRMFEVTGVSSLGTVNSEVRIRDVFTGDTIEVVLAADNLAEKVIDGQSYFFNVTGTNDAPVISVTWGDAADAIAEAADHDSQADPGDFITVFPVLKTEFNDEGVALTAPVRVDGLDESTTYSINLPTGSIDVVVAAGAASADISAVTTEEDESTVQTPAGPVTVSTGAAAPTTLRLGRTSGGGAFYNVTWTDDGTDGNLTIGMTSSSNPGVLLVEEEDDDGNLGSLFFASTWDDPDDETEVAAPVNSTVLDSGSREADTDIRRSVDIWGTWIERDTGDQSDVEIRYPDEQVSAAVFVLAKEATVGTGTTVAGRTVTAERPVAVKTPVAKLDSEVTSSDRSTKNIVAFGGPAVNTLVAELAAAGKTWDVQRYRDEGAGNAIVQMVNDAFAAGRAALIVAGHSAADTRAASRIVQLFDDNRAQLAGQSGVLVVNGAISGSIPA